MAWCEGRAVGKNGGNMICRAKAQSAALQGWVQQDVRMLAVAKCEIVERKSCLGGEQMWGKRSRRRRQEIHRVKPEEREREGTKGQEGEKIDYRAEG